MRHNNLVHFLILFSWLPQLLFAQNMISADEIINNTKKNFTKKLLDTPYLTKGYYVETAKCDGKYEVFMDGIGYGVYLGEQYNYAPLMRYRFFHENTRIHIGKPKKGMSSLYGHHGYITPNAFTSLARYLMLRYTGPLTRVKEYQFQLEESLETNHYIISFRSIGDDPTLTPKGKLKISKDDFQLTSITYLNEDKKLTNGKFPNCEITLDFVYINEQPFLSHSLVVYDYPNNNEHQIEYIMIDHGVVHFDVSKQEFINLNALTLNPFIQFNEKEWVIPQEIPIPDYVQKVINEIGGQDALHKSSLDLSGQWINGPGSNDFYYHKSWEDKISDLVKAEFP